MLYDVFKRFSDFTRLERFEGCGVIEEVSSGQITLVGLLSCVNCENKSICELYRHEHLRAKIIIEPPPNLSIGFDEERFTIKLKE